MKTYLCIRQLCFPHKEVLECLLIAWNHFLQHTVDLLAIKQSYTHTHTTTAYHGQNCIGIDEIIPQQVRGLTSAVLVNFRSTHAVH